MTPTPHIDPAILKLDAEAARWAKDAAFVRRLAVPPWMTLALLVVFALFHFYILALADGQEERAVFYLLISGAKVNRLVAQGEWWRLVSCAFLHGTFSHLLVNSLGVLLLGWFLENGAGRLVLVTTFVVSAAGGGLVSLAAEQAPSVGASGGMFGLLGATVTYALFRWRTIPRFVRAYVVGLPAAVGVFSVIYGLAAGNVDNTAHLGGGLCGACVGVLAHLAGGREGPGFRCAGLLVRHALILVTLFSLGATTAHLALRFSLPKTRLAVAHKNGVAPFLYPADWDAGRFQEGRCVLGDSEEKEGDILCFVDPFYSLYLVAPSKRLLASPVHAEYLRRQAREASQLYRNDTILWSADAGRNLAFALLSFDQITGKYVPLYAALRAAPLPADSEAESR